MRRFTTRATTRPALVAVVAGLCLVGILGSVSADEARVNPFRPEASADEEKGLEFKEKLRDAIREMLPEIRAKVSEDAEAQRAASIESTKRVILETIKNDPALMQRAPEPGTGGTGNPAAPANGGGAPKPAVEMEPTPLPEGARFLVCINGKPEYKDKDGTRFFREMSPGQTSPCSVGKLAAMQEKKAIIPAVAGALGVGAPGAAGASGMPPSPGMPGQPGGAGMPVVPPPPVVPGRPGAPGSPGVQAIPPAAPPTVNPQIPAAQRVIPVAPGAAGRPAVPPPVVTQPPGVAPGVTAPGASPVATPAVSTDAPPPSSNVPDMLRVTKRPGT